CRIPSDQSSKASENTTAFARVMAPTPVSHARIGQLYRRLSRPTPPRKRVEVRSHSGLQTAVLRRRARAQGMDPLRAWRGDAEHDRRWASTSLRDHSPLLGEPCNRARGKPAVSAAIAFGCSARATRTLSVVSFLSYMTYILRRAADAAMRSPLGPGSLVPLGQ